VSHYRTGDELEGELVACLTAFLASEEGARAVASARALGERARLSLRTTEPQAAVSVDFFAGTVATEPAADADVEIELEADALHDILMDRLDPVQLSRLYETERLVFRGPASGLAALIMLAGPLQPHYPASLERRGRTDLLETPAPPTKAVWGMPEEALSPRQVIGRRRAWQRPRRSAEVA
jgi:hypothetical protein